MSKIQETTILSADHNEAEASQGEQQVKKSMRGRPKKQSLNSTTMSENSKNGSQESSTANSNKKRKIEEITGYDDDIQCMMETQGSKKMMLNNGKILESGSTSKRITEMTAAEDAIARDFFHKIDIGKPQDSMEAPAEPIEELPVLTTTEEVQEQSPQPAPESQQDLKEVSCKDEIREEDVQSSKQDEVGHQVAVEMEKQPEEEVPHEQVQPEEANISLHNQDAPVQEDPEVMGEVQPTEANPSQAKEEDAPQDEEPMMAKELEEALEEPKEEAREEPREEANDDVPPNQ